MKALALFSGGLDSTIAIKVMQEQGIEIEALNFTSPFCRCAGNKGCGHTAQQAEKLGVKLHIRVCGEEYLRVVEKPKFGYGRNMNPCIDCRVFKFREARRIMDEVGASFMFTGEVLSQRPNSQRKDALHTIDREAGVQGLILRPLSAGFLEPTIPEINGWVDRNRLLSIKGRNRKVQMDLASHYGLNDYPCPAGGCLLTNEGFADKVRDLVEHGTALTIAGINRLKVGRHFRLTPTVKLIVGKNSGENELLEKLAQPDEYLLSALSHAGPVALLSGSVGQRELEVASRVVAKYSDAQLEEQVVTAVKGPDMYLETTVMPFSDRDLDPYRIVRQFNVPQ